MHNIKSPPFLIGLIILTTILLFALIGPMLNQYSYYETHLALKNLSPSSLHWFGTDDLGRDVFVRTCYGARISLLVGVSAALVDVVIGVLWGSIAAYSGGWIDELMMRIADLLFTLPNMLIVLLVMVVLGSGLIPIIIALTIVGWITMARIVRAQILKLKEMEFIQASISLGASKSHILLTDLIPNALSPIIVTMTLTIPSAIFTEAFMSFLGLGVQAPIASWGTMANEGLPALQYYPWRLFFPSLFISLTMFAFNLIGNSLRDSLDPNTNVCLKKQII